MSHKSITPPSNAPHPTSHEPSSNTTRVGARQANSHKEFTVHTVPSKEKVVERPVTKTDSCEKVHPWSCTEASSPWIGDAFRCGTIGKFFPVSNPSTCFELFSRNVSTSQLEAHFRLKYPCIEWNQLRRCSRCGWWTLPVSRGEIPPSGPATTVSNLSLCKALLPNTSTQRKYFSFQYSVQWGSRVSLSERWTGFARGETAAFHWSTLTEGGLRNRELQWNVLRKVSTRKFAAYFPTSSDIQSL